MGKGKLKKFADMASYDNVVEHPYSVIDNVDFPLRGNWNRDFFKNGNPIVLELGCGRGEYTVALAKRFPGKNFIGVDIKGARMWTGATEAKEAGLTNVGFLRTNIEIIDRLFEQGEVSEIWLTFPDPQMKKFTKRLTSSLFLARYRDILAPDAVVHLKTDSNFLFTYTKYITEVNGLPVVECIDDVHGQPRVSDTLQIRTYYESQWLSRGIKIKYLAFNLPAKECYEEPNVEIELDEYRSYNRSKRSSLETSK
ncbi:MAG: tRNA (guanosine(46)-N7)-methyltransferase TrmB [Bacteroidaceae bacterium]|nr:tRNA (guanosine(46)-N7)-methyltransferase TrmB [Bacteroidaceae bacterium]